MTERLKQAIQETAFTAGLAFGLSFLAWLTGLAALPDLGAAQAAIRAATLAALIAVGKGGLWHLTGTVIVPDDRPIVSTGKKAVRIDK